VAWDVSHPAARGRRSWRSAHGWSLRAVADGLRFATVTNDEQDFAAAQREWRSPGSTDIRKPTAAGHVNQDNVNFMAYSQDSSLFIAAGADERVVWDMRSFPVQRARCAAVRLSGRIVAVAVSSGTWPGRGHPSNSGRDPVGPRQPGASRSASHRSAARGWWFATVVGASRSRPDGRTIATTNSDDTLYCGPVGSGEAGRARYADPRSVMASALSRSRRQQAAGDHRCDR